MTRIASLRKDPTHERRAGAIDIPSFIPAGAVVVPLIGTDKASVLSELTAALFPQQGGSLRYAVYEGLIHREALQSTAIGLGIALPHAQVAGLADLVCAVGVSRRGLSFGSIDEEPVFTVIVTAYPPGKQGTYLAFVSAVVSLLQDARTRQAIRAARNESQVLEHLSGTGGREDLGARARREHGAPPPATLLKAAGSDVTASRTDLLLLWRLEVLRQMCDTTEPRPHARQERVDFIRSVLGRTTLQHYDQLVESGRRPISMVDGDVCQGCSVRLPTRLRQAVREAPDTIRVCPHCASFLYLA